jgi:hypothetical protein
MATTPRSPADEAYEQVRAIALRFPETEEKLSHGAPSFHVRGKLYLQFIDHHQHPDDGRIAVWCKSTLEEQRRLVERHPARFFVPPYVGVRGWVGVNVDAANADWIELSILVEDAWRSVAPPRVVRGEAVPRAVPPLPPSPRVTTDAEVARIALERITAICSALPEVTRDRTSHHATFRVHKKVFAYFVDNHHGDGRIAVCVKGDKREHAGIIAEDPKHYFLPAYTGGHGYVGIRLDTRRVDWKGVEQRVIQSYRNVAPKRLLAADPAPSPRRVRSR